MQMPSVIIISLLNKNVRFSNCLGILRRAMFSNVPRTYRFFEIHHANFNIIKLLKKGLCLTFCGGLDHLMYSLEHVFNR